MTTEGSGLLDIDDIFNRLKETRVKEEEKEKGDASESSMGTGMKKQLTYEELKKKVSHLPSIESHLYSGHRKDSDKKKSSREIRRINDTVESVLPDLHKKTVTDRRLLKEQKSKEWFALPKVELTDDVKRDLLIIKNRKYLDPKRFYRGEKWEIPENFQIGEIVEGVGEYGGKFKRKSRGQTLVDELLKNKDSATWFSKTYSDIQVRKKSGGKKSLKDKITKRKKY